MFRFMLFAAAFLFAGNVQAQTTKRPPNILIIVADDLGYADLGFQGCKDIPTPNLDKFAQRGVRCTNGYVSGPYCSPTRAGLLTGRYQTRFGHEFNPGAMQGLPVDQTTIAQRFKAAGYRTGLVGKWHLGANAKMHPNQRGFDDFYGFLGGAHSYFPGKDNSETILRGNEVVHEKEYLTDAIARESVAFIEKNKQSPFLLYLAFNAVHTPMHATDPRLQKFANIADKTRRTYAAMLWAMDEAIGQVLDKVTASGLDDDTLIFFFSDNGGPTMQGTTVNASSNLPLRGSKRTTLEGGIHVPFLVAWKGKLPAGKTYNEPVIQLDVLPTALSAAGVKIDPDWKLDGVNLLPFLDGSKQGSPHEALYWRFGQQRAIRQGDWVLVTYDAAVEGGKSDKKGQGGVIGPRLYNLATDIGQTRDLFAMEPERAKTLQAAWDRWNTQNVAPLWGGGAKGE